MLSLGLSVWVNYPQENNQGIAWNRPFFQTEDLYVLRCDVEDHHLNAGDSWSQVFWELNRSPSAPPTDSRTISQCKLCPHPRSLLIIIFFFLTVTICLIVTVGYGPHKLNCFHLSSLSKVWFNCILLALNLRANISLHDQIETCMRWPWQLNTYHAETWCWCWNRLMSMLMLTLI